MEDMEIIKLQNRIRFLEKENSLLKERMKLAGISYDDLSPDTPTEEARETETTEGTDLYDPDQGARIRPFEITDKTANTFFMMFCRGRKDVYELRYTNPKTGKTGYYTQCWNRWHSDCHKQKKDNVRCKDCEIQSYKALTPQIIKAQMRNCRNI